MKHVPPSEQVIEGEVVRGPGYIPNEPATRVQARVVPRPPPPPPPAAMQPNQQHLNVQLGDAVGLSLPVSPMGGLLAVAGAVLAYKFVLPKVVEALGGTKPRRRRIKIKLLPAGGK